MHGRILYGYLNLFFYSNIDSVNHLVIMRIISFVGCMAVAACMCSVMVKSKIDKYTISYTLLYFISSASLAVIIGWCATFQVGWAILVALIAAAIFPGKQTYLIVLVRIVLGVISLMLYQPAYAIFILVVLLLCWVERDSAQFLKYFMVYVATYIIYFLLHQLILDLLVLEPWRSELSVDFPGKIKWFFSTVLFNIFGFNLKSVSNGTVNLLRIPTIIVLLIAGLKFFIEEGFKAETIKWSIVVLLAVFGSYVANLMSVESWYTNRTGVVLTFLFAYLLFQAVHYIFGRSWSFIINSFLTVVFVVFGFINIRNFSCLNRTEYLIVQEALGQILTNNENVKLKVIGAPRAFLETEGIIQKTSAAEFGEISASFDWSTEPMVLQISKENFKNKKITFCEGACSDAHSVDLQQLYLKNYDRYLKSIGGILFVNN